ncbi:MAG: LLM class flavin-dependent oxidoreductase [Deltaproteobacteria bacterium]|jgi:alkanesulfonate monooxygenase SsuD/methylene tetrahydromethanopterin reductase-like flavin-dependent oxidoreductase (luciferase family)|nr:LLM class flavin-dependent oxidoreductase [Deltaproteobacteria bacterium]MBW2495836.1 LLM class flavin-dependent oxidoreductase [Deltaproteobacteria bacterium]
MKFALFAEIPVPRPWTPGKEARAIRDTIDQAVFAEEMGFHSFWAVEHHFLEEFSHCSNPEVIYAAVAARTERLRIGYGVRLAPKPYNHPVRTAESAATLDCVSDGRVEFGLGRSASRLELEGFGVDPNATRDMLEEAMDHVVGCWTNETHGFEGRFWSMPQRTVVPKPVQQPHPPLWIATTTPDGHRWVGGMGTGVLSFAVGVPPEDLIPRVEAYREGLARCTQPKGLFRNEQVATFTMVHCAPTSDQAFDEAADSMIWYVRRGSKQVADLADYARRFSEDGENLGSYFYARRAEKTQASGALEAMDFGYLRDHHAAMVGDPDRCIEIAKRYEAAGCDVLFCLMNPYAIPHEQVMQSIELIGRHVIPAFDTD